MKKYIYIIVLMVINITYSFCQDGIIDTTYGEKGTVFLEHQFQRNETIIDIEKDHNNRLLFLFVEKKYVDSFYILENIGTTKIRRFTEDGLIDKSFGTDGLVEIPVGPFDYYKAFSCQPDNKIVLVGDFPVDSINASERYYCNTKIVLLRLLENGKKDDSFGMQGEVFIDLDTILRGNNLAFQKDGKILVTGELRSGRNEYGSDLLLLRLDSFGRPDTSFGQNGIVIEDIYNFLFDMESGDQIFIMDDNSIIISCLTYYIESGWWWSINRQLLVKFDQSGNIVFYSDSGICILLEWWNRIGRPFISQVYKNNDDSFLVSYYTGGDYWFPGYPYLKKINKNGMEDSSFGDQGTFAVFPSSLQYWFGQIESSADGEILIFGGAQRVDMTTDNPVVTENYLILMRISSKGISYIKFGNLGMCLWNPEDLATEVRNVMIINSNEQYIKVLGSAFNSVDSSYQYFITRIKNYQTSLINEIENSELTIFPNPTSGTFTLDLPEDFNTEKAVMKVFDLYGRVVMEKKGMEIIRNHDINYLLSGIYFIELNSIKGKSVSRLIKM